MKRSQITSMLLPISILLFTACETKQPMMHDSDWHWGMGWGTWIVPLLVILVIIYFLRTRRRKW